MAKKRNQNITERDQGLTVGELTIAIGSILFIVLLWNIFSSKKADEQSTRHINSVVISRII